MNDRELLEMAAKAAGLFNPQYEQSVAGNWNIYHGDAFDPRECWNPLADDGDALRLAVRLNFEIERSKLADRAYVGPVGEAPWVEYVNDEQDIYECTRRAIVRAAAEIGRSLP